jgi:hypothetical protein
VTQQDLVDPPTTAAIAGLAQHGTSHRLIFHGFRRHGGCFVYGAMKPKLFHTLVVMGAALTGASVVTTACGGGTNTCDPMKTDCYPHISFNPDAYPHIGFNPDGYPNISIDTGTQMEGGKEGGDAAQDSASDAEAG